ncbi:thiamine phosphate synthase [Segatella copri]|uniref:thiamine phosphate synthase n=1 Tax=Segatella copri TaxID=165179 RepID=UPI002646D19F|nr:thiamine phosphate synthase [Segatella copri]
MAKIPLDSFQLQFISHQNEKMTYLDGIREALAGGCKWIQLRMKGATDEEVRPIALKVKKLCKEQNATFLIDDRVQLVKEVGADGVHLGKNDMPIAEARKILGDDFIIGGTANTFEDVKAHYEAGADYIGCGPFHFTTTKKKLSPILGLEGYHEIIQKMKAENIDIPIVAIGGITKEDIPDIMKTGVNGIALSGSILNAKDPASETHDIMEMMKEFR